MCFLHEVVPRLLLLVACVVRETINTMDRTSTFRYLIWCRIRSQHGKHSSKNPQISISNAETTQLSIQIYNNDVYAANYSASVLAATTFLRFTISSSFPLFTPQMVRSLGFAWATSLLGLVTVAMIPIPWVFFKWGPVLRSKSRYLRRADSVEALS